MAINYNKKLVPIIGKKEEFKPPVIDYADMAREMQEYVIEQCEEVLRMFNNGEKKHYYECAEAIKKILDDKYSGSFHVVMGRDFGSYFNYEVGNCIQFWIMQHCFLIFKHG
jgi:dynein light chain LC8-type